MPLEIHQNFDGPFSMNYSFPFMLRILASSVVMRQKQQNFWTFWPVIQPINHLFVLKESHITFCCIITVIIIGRQTQNVDLVLYLQESCSVIQLGIKL